MVMPRRHPLPLLARIRGMVWPHSGWRRAGSYILHRLHRLPGTPHGIAAGLASGIGISFMPLIGLHLLGAFALSWLLRGNYLAAAIGSLIGNPWTLPFMLATDYRLGCYLLGQPAVRLDWFADLSWSGLLDNLWLVFWPMLVGGAPLAIISGLGSYLLLVPLVARIQQRRRRRIAARIKAVLDIKAGDEKIAPPAR